MVLAPQVTIHRLVFVEAAPPISITFAADAAVAPSERRKGARVRSRVGAVEIPVEVTDGIMPGVVSIPHGWGHDADGAEMAVAGRHAGVNTNLLADGSQLDPLSGNAVLNGIPVSVEAKVPAGA